MATTPSCDWAAHASWLCAVPTEAIEAVLIDRDSQTIARRHFQAELAVLEWLFEDFLGEKERPEQFGTPFELGKGRKELRGRGSSNRTFQHCAAVETDTCSLADRSDLGGGEQAAGLRNLQGKHVGCRRLGELECCFRAA